MKLPELSRRNLLAAGLAISTARPVFADPAEPLRIGVACSDPARVVRRSIRCRPQTAACGFDFASRQLWQKL
jgi:hypothetical protein